MTHTTHQDRLEGARKVAAAVLYEGYLLYPYRASSVKNQVRWQFGVVGPVGAEQAGVGEGSRMHTECLFDPHDAAARIAVTVRFLQVQSRAVERLTSASPQTFEPTDELVVGTARWIPWHEAVEHELAPIELEVGPVPVAHAVPVHVAAAEEVELLCGADGGVVGRLVRRRTAVTGDVLVTTTPTRHEGLTVVRVELRNTGLWEGSSPVGPPARDLAARSSFVGTHILLGCEGGRFVSIVDPPAWAAEDAARCTSSRCWPVLVGEPGAQTAELVLASPIILPEHPAVAAESPGDLFDATEIDEILTLRIMTLTDEEKAAARGTDPRAAAIIDRSDGLPPEIFERLHGAIRGFGPDTDTDDIPTFGAGPDWFSEEADAAVSPETDGIVVAGQRIAKGSHVRLVPRRRADAHDMFLRGRTAVVARVDVDVDGATHIAVLLDDDPARELQDWHKRYYYFGPEEITPVDLPPAPAGAVS